MSALLAMILVASPSGLELFKHQRPGGPCCNSCGAEVLRVQALIRTMQTHPKWRERDDAAHALRKFDAACHPEIGSALAAAMLHDCHEEVREEAAESLAKLAPCRPDVHAALLRASECDPDHATRKWASRALKNLKHECVGPCDSCGTIATTLPTRFLAPTQPATWIRPQPLPPGGGLRIAPSVPVPSLEGYYVPPGSYDESPYGMESAPASPLDALPPVEVAPPELPPSPSPFLPGATRGEDETDQGPIRRASTSREPSRLRLGQRIFGAGR